MMVENLCVVLPANFDRVSLPGRDDVLGMILEELGLPGASHVHEQFRPRLEAGAGN
jgi:hypothetical protein